jgi:hypothetical protein
MIPCEIIASQIIQSLAFRTGAATKLAAIKLPAIRLPNIAPGPATAASPSAAPGQFWQPAWGWW